MKVVEILDKLDIRIGDIKQKYCENCQEWDCYECPYEMEDGDGKDV